MAASETFMTLAITGMATVETLREFKLRRSLLLRTHEHARM